MLLLSFITNAGYSPGPIQVPSRPVADALLRAPRSGRLSSCLQQIATASSFHFLGDWNTKGIFELETISICDQRGVRQVFEYFQFSTANSIQKIVDICIAYVNYFMDGVSWPGGWKAVVKLALRSSGGPSLHSNWLQNQFQRYKAHFSSFVVDNYC